MGKYDPLRRYMSDLKQPEWTAGFDEIGDILGKPLPPSASEHRTWWANHGGQMVHQQAWLDAGWRVDAVDLSRRQVVFRRIRYGGRLASSGAPGNGNSHAGNGGTLPASFARTIEKSRQLASISVRLDWTDIGVPQRVNGSSWALPEAPQSPGLCRIHTISESRHNATIIVVRDLCAFLNTLFASLEGDTGHSAIMSLCERVAAARYISIDAVLPGQAWIVIDGRGTRADLENMAERSLIERAVAILSRNAGVAVSRLKSTIN